MPDATKPEENDGFEDLVRRLDDGSLLPFLDDDVRELVGALQKEARHSGGKPKGTLTLTLSFVQDGTVIGVKPTVKVVLPKPTHATSVFWPTKDNRLSPQNPKQLGLELRDNNPTGLRKVD